VTPLELVFGERDVTPLELVFGEKPKYHSIGFGQEVYFRRNDPKLGKLDSKASIGYFVGFPDDVKGVWVYYDNKVQVSRSWIVKEAKRKMPNSVDKEEELEFFTVSESKVPVEPVATKPRTEELILSGELNESSDSDVDGSQVGIGQESVDPNETQYFSDNDVIGEQTLPVGRMLRNPDDVVIVKEGPGYHIEEVDEDLNPHERSDITSTNVVSGKRPRKDVNYDTFAFKATDALHWKKALKGSEGHFWLKAMKEEMRSLHNKQTWKLMRRRHGKRAIPCFWVLTKKQNQDGSVKKYKARLVILGNRQEYGIDYKETFSPTLKFTSIRLLLHLATVWNWVVYQFDIKTAFVNGDLDEEVYMKQPDGFPKATDSRGEELVSSTKSAVWA
jgi:hypothetical protein